MTGSETDVSITVVLVELLDMKELHLSRRGLEKLLLVLKGGTSRLQQTSTQESQYHLAKANPDGFAHESRTFTNFREMLCFW